MSISSTMVSIATARQLALSMPGATEQSHFEIPDFRVKKKIFASLHEDKNYMMVKLSLVEQSVFCQIDEAMIFPVPGGWGRAGATFINLKKVNRVLLRDAIKAAYEKIAGKK
jgi:hypothetical protein